MEEKGAMKNRVIKKIMAYLLVGAMVITTPMTASAAEGILPEAYGLDQSGAGAENDESTGSVKLDTNTSTGTSTSTSTSTQATEIPDEVIKKIPQILGISLDQTILAFDAPDQAKPIQARVVFDDYDAGSEEMEWADPITLKEKEEIEKQIRWFSDDYNVASFGSNEQNDTKTGSKAVVKSVAGGQTKIYAWIEADGQVYTDGNGNPIARPTPGDFVAEATVTVKNTVKKITFNVNDDKLGFKEFTKFASGKRQYDLKKYTILEYTDETKELASSSNVNLTYSITDTKALKANGVTATLTEAGILKISKGDAGKEIAIDIVSENGVHQPATIKLVVPNPVTKIDKLPKIPILDLGIENNITYEVTIPSSSIENKDKTTGIDNSTDELIWSSNKPAIADVQSEGNGEKATIIAKGVGTAKITVKASSGKSASATVTVHATPSDVKFEGTTTGYSGQPIALTAVLLGDKGQELPLGTTKLKWEIAKIGTKKDPNAKVSAKKDVATVTPANLLNGIDLSDLSKPVNTTVNVTTTYKDPNQTYKKTKQLPVKSHIIALKQSDVKNVSIDIFQRVQNEGKDHTYDSVYTMGITNGKNTKESWAVTFNAKTKEKFYVGQKYFMEAKSSDTESQKQIDSVAWAVTGKGVNYSANAEQLTTDFTSNAKTTVKASYITIDRTKAKAIKNTKTINITPIQNATSIAFAKPVVVKNPAKNTTKPQAVTFAIKDIVPKKANYGTVTWKVMAYDGEKTTVFGMPATGSATVNNNLVASQNNKSIKVNVPGNFKAGSVIKVGAYTQVGVVAYGYIYITEQTTKVIPMASKNGAEAKEAGTKKDNTQTIKLGSEDKLVLSAKLDTKVFEDGKSVPYTGRDVAMGEDKLGNNTYSTTTAYQTEPVTYSLDKKSALIVKVDANGNVTPLKKGTATVTIKTLSNKSAKVKIIVE